MSKKAIFIQVCIAVFAVPFVSFAATAIGGSAVASGPVLQVVAPAAPCYAFGRSLSVGVRGGDVTVLQDFLREQGDFNISSTGYFGALTKAAVGRWQAQNDIAASGSAGSGIFGPLSRASFARSCGNGGGGTGNGNVTSTQSFSASPSSGLAPLTVQFTATAPQGDASGRFVDFGDGTTGTLQFAPVCSNCNALAVVSHTYVTAGTYTAVWNNGPCACPAGAMCNCPNMPIFGTATVTVDATSTATSSGIEQVNAPGTATLSPGGIAEIRNESTYFTLEGVATSSATIQITPVGCWNSFPSDPTPKIRCMLAMVPIPLQTLMVGQNFSAANYTIALTQLSSSTATFSIAAK